MSARTFTEDEVLAVVKAVVKAERCRGNLFLAQARAELEGIAAEMADGNRRLLEYARTGNVAALESPKEDR